jgi:heptosyltransferase-2
MAALVSARLVICNDSGAMHLASALGVPTLAIFGSTEPQLTGPMGARSRVLRHHVPCSPCFLRECPLDFACMKSITAKRAVLEAETLLR